MTLSNKTTIKLQISKTILENILNRKNTNIEINASKYWIKELLDISLVDDKLVSSLKSIKQIYLSNGLHKNLPIYCYECLDYKYDNKNNKFIFNLGKKLG